MIRTTAVLFACVTATLFAAEPYTARPLGSTTAPYGFLEHLPSDYSKTPATRYPLVFFMHGMGELGDSDKNLAAVAKHGPFKHIAAQDEIGKLIDENHAIVIGPQGLKSDNWWNTPKLMDTLRFALKEYPVDPDRVYVTGLSMGGGGTFALGTAMPEVVAAMIPVCPAAGKAGNVAKLKGMPIWTHHAFNDGTVKFADNTQSWYDALVASLQAAPAGALMTGYQGGDKTWTGQIGADGWAWQEGVPTTAPAAPAGKQAVLVTVYPDKSHDSWSRTYKNPVVWNWLFAQSRAKRAQ